MTVRPNHRNDLGYAQRNVICATKQKDLYTGKRTHAAIYSIHFHAIITP